MFLKDKFLRSHSIEKYHSFLAIYGKVGTGSSTPYCEMVDPFEAVLCFTYFTINLSKFAT